MPSKNILHLASPAALALFIQCWTMAAPNPLREYKANDGSAMVLIHSGKFRMGSPENIGDADEHPRHELDLRDYFISRTDVTNGQYSRFLNAYGKDTDKGGHLMVYEFPNGLKKVMGKWQAVPGFENCPVVNVTWYGAVQYCRTYGLRLPTEAEWEKAARAGNDSKFAFGDDELVLSEYAWYFSNSSGTSHPVGTKNPNAWGLYDMAGNVWQWCGDRYNADYYKSSPEKDPQGPGKGRERVIRGGSWVMIAGNCRPSLRLRSAPHTRSENVGFRCACSSPGSK